MILLYISNDLKSSYEIKVNDAYIEGFDVGKRKGIEECREIIRDYKPLYNE